MIKKKAHIVCLFPLCSCVQHVFNEDAISGCWVVDEDMGDGDNQFSFLKNR